MFASQESVQVQVEVRQDGKLRKDETEQHQQDGLSVKEGGTAAPDFERTEAEDIVTSQHSDDVTMGKTAERMVVMIPESSSDSSLAMFSPVQVDSQDQLMDMFSDPDQEQENVSDELEEEDILTEMEDLE